MVKKTLLIEIPVVVVFALVAAIIAPSRLAHTSAIETKAVGVWQETDSREAYKLVIHANPGAAEGIAYTMTYPRPFKLPFPASLSGNEILIWGENTDDIVWTVVYNEQTDTLAVRPPNGSETHTLKRIADREAPAPKWLLRQARIMAGQGKASKAWWTKTTLELALRAVEPGTGRSPARTTAGRPICSSCTVRSRRGRSGWARLLGRLHGDSRSSIPPRTWSTSREGPTRHRAPGG